MKPFSAAIICIGLFASALAQYGIPEDDDDHLPPASYQQQEVHLPAVVSRLQTTPAPKSYTKYEDEEPLAMSKYNPIYAARRHQPVSVYTEPVVIKTAVQPLTVQIQKENVQYEQPILITVRATEKPVTAYSAVPTTSSTQIQFSDDDNNDYSSVAGRQQRYSSSNVRSDVVPIVKYVMDNDHRGTFRLETVTGDGTSNTVTGQLKDLGGSEGPVVVKEGSYEYTGDNGQVYRLNWVADEGGFRAFAKHLPTLNGIN